ncbi:sensor histidine kinase [Ruegeria faecimaris]|uniref:sensor histidine kinase n=1 Tax=Ruegeria faecimaris TaxID=686389 RepID=UPI00233116D9|nr:HAMP domain-containing sensor histidine kinase [Ruegeria faecimaris]
MPSYYFGKADYAPNSFSEKEVEVDCQTLKVLSESEISEELELELRIQIEEAGLNPDGFEFAALSTPNSPWTQGENTSDQSLLGILGCSAGQLKFSPSGMSHHLDHLAQQIEISRLHRFHHAVKSTQSLLNEVERDVDKSLKNIGHMVKSEISAKRFIYKNDNSDHDWMEIEDAGGQLTSSLQQIEFREGDDPSKFGHIQKRMALLSSDTAKEETVELLVVPFLQPSYRLRSLPFTSSSDLIENLETSKSNDINLIFLAKDAPGYLQNCFSDTDMLVAKSVFGYIEKYASAKIFEENSSRVLKFLKEKPGSSVNLSGILDTLKSLSVHFSSLTSLVIQNVQSNIEIVEEHMGENEPLAHGYLERLKENYLSKFFSNQDAFDSSDLFFGVDKDDRGFILEVHFPSNSGSSKIFVARYDSDQISESILKSFVNLFSEVYVRTKKQEHQSDRAAYIMQVRHAVIHHFSAANRSIRSIRPLWNRGIKNKEYWISLLSDPVIEGELDRAITSLGQANLIIENGRFLLGNIDPKSLNRKPYKFVDVVNDCIQVLQDIRDEKHIRIVSKVTGNPPRVMNADEPLLHIAIMNLFDNAIKYSPHHKTIRWTVDYRRDHFRFELSSVGDKLDPTKRELLFQVGFRGNQRDRLNQRHGTGLGLPVAYKILKAHSDMAQLDFKPEQSNVDLGGDANTFYFEMPYLTGQASAKDE